MCIRDRIGTYHAYEQGEDVNSAVNSALGRTDATSQQVESVIARLDTGGYVEGIFEHSAAGNYAVRMIDRLTERGIELAQQLIGDRTEFFATAHIPLTHDERRAIEPVAQQLMQLLADPANVLSPEDENALSDLARMIDLLLLPDEPDRLVAKRVVSLLARKSGEVAISGAAWDGLKEAVTGLMGLLS